MKVSRGQPWKARARASMHWTMLSRSMAAFSELRILGLRMGMLPFMIVEGVHLEVLEKGRMSKCESSLSSTRPLPQINQMIRLLIAQEPFGVYDQWTCRENMCSIIMSLTVQALGWVDEVFEFWLCLGIVMMCCILWTLLGKD